MGYKIFQNLSKLKKVLKNSAVLTENFSDLGVDKIAKYPQMLLVIRLATAMPQRRFSKTIGITRAALAQYELGTRKKMKINTIEKINTNLPDVLSLADFSEKYIIENFKKMWHQAEFGQDPDKLREYGRKAINSRKPTYDEATVINILKKMKINHERDGILYFMGIPFSFDFLIPNSKNPRLVIECKKIQSKHKRSFRIASCHIAYELGYKFRLLRDEFPEIQTALILESEFKKLPERVIKVFKKEIDILLLNESKEKIINSLANHPRSG